MIFKTCQALELSGVSADALRHWKKVLVPLSGRDGRACSYSLADVVALAVIDRAVRGMGIPVSKLAPGAVELFEAVADHLTTGGAAAYMFISGDAVNFGGLGEMPIADGVALVRIDIVAEAIQRAVSEGSPPDPQLRLL